MCHRSFGFTVDHSAKDDLSPSETPASMNGTVRRIINCCWATNPDDRLTSDEFDALFERMEYKLTPQVEVGRVRAFVASLSQ
jgi:hypothetical protein